uniref:LRRCT domain-containing protein n=1 Tax=Xenopus tropicalis TaxID=8364 RepID=A0A1B8XZ41_XENTR
MRNLSWASSAGECIHEETYVCLSIPKDADYPANITSLLFIKTAKEITASLFTNPNLKSVQRLNLPLNGIESVQPGAFRVFERLSSFALSGNFLKAVSPDWFYESVPLESLNVTNNSVEEIRPEMLATLSSLKILDFSANRIRKIGRGSFSGLAKLTALDLSNNRISFLPGDVLSPLQNASFKLGNNPWNCSCPLKDFAVFLQELRNSSRLKDPENVICRSPPPLNGTSIWNVPFTNCSSTNTEIPATTGAQPIIGTVLLVILVIILFPLLLFLIWKKKQENKQVQPNGEGTDSRTASDTGRWTMMGGKISLKGVLFHKDYAKDHSRTHKDYAKDHSRTHNALKMGRSKSASAILLKSDFFQPKTRKDGKQESCQKQDISDKTVSFLLGNLDSRNMELCYYNSLEIDQGKSLSGGGPMTMAAEMAQDLCPTFYSQLDTGSPKWATAVLSTEASCNLPLPDSNLDSLGPLVYLSVNTNAEEPVVISSTNQVVSQKENHLKLRPLRRTYTWPKERVQSEQDTDSSYETFLKTLHLSPKPTSRTSENRQSNDNQNQDYRPEGGYSHRFDKKGESKSPCGVYKPMSSTRKVYQSPSPYSGRQKSQVASSETASRRGELNSRGSVEQNDQRVTPDDDTLLENNEYNFIDLLHEVVENHGRWTRDRWRQIHQQRLPHRSSPMS